MSLTDSPTTTNVDVTFYDNFVPSLKDGEYAIKVSQILAAQTDPTGSLPDSPHAPVVQKFIVRGPRFVLLPIDKHRRFPPKKGTGTYHEYLPMLVLNKRALPWEREMKFPDAWHIQDPDKYPWVALLVFTQDELAIPQPASGTVTPPPPGSQANPTRSTSFLLTDVVHATFNGVPTQGPPSGIFGPTITLEDDEDPNQIHANVIDIPVEHFVNLMPSVKDLGFLNHVREVSTEHKTPQNAKHDGWFSVVMSNRFAIPPAANSETKQMRNIVHLVSLEGFEQYLGPDAPVAPSGYQKVRMISLYSWTYTCLPDPQVNFRQLMLDLVAPSTRVGLTPSALQGSVTAIPLKAPGASEAVLKGALLEVVDPNGPTRALVTTSADVIPGADSLPIEAHTFSTAMHAESAVILAASEVASKLLLRMPLPAPAEQLRTIEALATTASALEGSVTAIPLPALAGTSQAIAQNTLLEMVDPTGTIRALVTTSAAVAAGALSIPIEAHNFTTAMPAGSLVGPAADFVAIDRVEDGYLPLSYALRTGEQTFAWYRGPLTPVATERFLTTTDPGDAENPAAPMTASEAMVYDPISGLFDESYATAFQTGRSLALASKPFATNLLHWRREAHGLIDVLLEYMRSAHWNRILQNDHILDAEGNLTSVGVKDLAELLSSDIISNAFKDFLATDFIDSIAKKVGKMSGFTPSEDDTTLTGAATRQPSVPADLIKLMQQPQIASLLQQLSGLTPLGTTAAALLGSGVTSISLTAPGALEAVEAGVTLTVTSPDGKTVALVKTSNDIGVGATQVPIDAHDFTVSMPAGSTVRVGDSNIMPEQITAWLAQLALLYTVPFNNLVPNERMLPKESLRFFYVDRNWIDSLLDGALSVGIQSSRDSLFHQLMRAPLHRAVDDALHQVRDKLRGVPPTTPTKTVSMAGFVLRSAVVSGWTGLEVRAWSAANPTTPMKPLRLDHVSPSILLGLYPDVPVKVEFNEPSEGLVFGTEDEGIDLRYLPGTHDATKDNIGQYIEPKVTLPPTAFPKRAQPAENAALKIGGSGGLVEALQNKFPAPKPTLTPASFAVEMVRVPEQMLFEPEHS